MKLDKRTCLNIGVTVFLLYLVIHYWSRAASVAGLVLGAAMPLILGCGIAYLLNIVMTGLEKYLLDRGNALYGQKNFGHITVFSHCAADHPSDHTVCCTGIDHVYPAFGQ